jgi:polysaccharide biosynthesis protein PslG
MVVRLLIAASLGCAATAEAPVRGARLVRLLGGGAVPDGLGVNVHFTESHLEELRRIQSFGFRVVRTDLLWADVERERGAYDWRRYDALVADLRTADLIPLLILAYSNPLYARRLEGRPRNSPSLAYAAPREGEARGGFMRFARAAAERYGADVIWEIWNEPNLNFGQPVDPIGYVGFAMEACKQIREAVPAASVIGPAASGFSWSLLQRLIPADTAGCIDGISVHPYRDAQPESVLSDWANLIDIAKCADRKPCPTIVSSEWGYSVTGGTWTAERQADFVMRLYLLNLLAGVPLSILYDWQDDGPDPHNKEANFGIVDRFGQPKPVYRALGQLLWELKGLTLMGRVDTEWHDTFILAFGEKTLRKLVGWTSSGATVDVLIPKLTCARKIKSGGPVGHASACGEDGFPLRAAVRMHLSGRPSVIDATPLPSNTAPLRDAAEIR